MKDSSNLEMPSEGVMSLLFDAHSHSDYSGERYYFKGDLHQKSTAEAVARQLSIKTDREGGLPFVMSQQDFDTVTKYLIEHQMDGWHHYVTYQEYCEITGKYTFGGKYLPHREIIYEIANKFDIYVSETNVHVLYATSKEDYNTITEELDKVLA